MPANSSNVPANVTPVLHATGYTRAVCVSRTLRLGLVPVACAITVAACGSAAKPERSVDIGASAQGVKYSDCMRAHGVPDFPDLNADGSVSLPSTIDPESPAFQSAEGVCASLRPGPSTPPPPISLTQQKSFDANAKCMRTHGIPAFPDPSFGPGGEGVGINWPAGAPYPTAGALLLDSRRCAHVGSPLPLRGVPTS